MAEQAAITGTTRLVFGGVDDLSLGEIGEVLRDVDQIYWKCVEAWDEDAGDRDDLRPRVERITLASPLELLLELPSIAWQAGFGFTFVGALAMIFKVPARFQKERWQFWQTRLAADRAKREWVEEREAYYAKRPINLVELRLPDEAIEVLDEEEQKRKER